MKIALIFPRINSPSGDPPLGLGYLSAYIKSKTADFDIKIFDGTFSANYKILINKILDFNPNIAGLYLNTLHYETGLKILNTLKNKNIKTICGGPHSTILPETLVDYCDFIIRCEAEKSFFLLINSIKQNSNNYSNIPGIYFKKNNSIIQNDKFCFTDNLDEFPFPDYDDFEYKRYLNEWSYLDSISTKKKGVNIIASRGCPFSCSYCQPTLNLIFGKKIRFRSAENIFSEMEKHSQKLNNKNFFFHDDTFTINKKLIFNLCNLIKDKNYLWGCNTRVDTVDYELLKKMYESGLRVVHLGIENGNQRILDQIYKKQITIKQIKSTVDICNKIGIKVMAFFMIGAPRETIEEINNTIRFANKLNIHEATFNIATPLPKTYLAEYIKKNNYKINNDFSKYNYYSNKVFYDDNISLKKIKYLQFKALFLFYINPKRISYLIKHLFSIKGVKKIFNKILRFI